MCRTNAWCLRTTKMTTSQDEEWQYTSADGQKRKHDQDDTDEQQTTEPRYQQQTSQSLSSVRMGNHVASVQCGLRSTVCLLVFDDSAAGPFFITTEDEYGKNGTLSFLWIGSLWPD